MTAQVVNRPFWLERADSSFPSLNGDLEVDVAVIGAGITGATAALLLKQAGKTVALLESSRVCHGATGYTTAKLTVGHSLVYHELIETFGEETARLYARSNQEAIEQVAALVEEHELECDFERASNYVYAESQAAVAKIEREVAAAQAAGVDAALTTETDLPYAVAAAVRVDDQAQFHPWKYVAGLARLVDGDGSHVFEETRATGVSTRGRCTVETTGGVVRAQHVVVATQLPFLDRGLFFARAHPLKSYAVAASIEEQAAPRGMYISVDEPTRSIRSTPGDHGRRIVIVGGEGHTPGTSEGSPERYARLEQFLGDRFGVAAAEFRWSTHDYVPVDRLPFIGRLWRGSDRVYVATGFAKWGLTKGTFAAAMIRDAILGRANPYAALYDATRVDARHSVRRVAEENAKVGFHFVYDRLRRRAGSADLEALAPGEGAVIRIGGRHLAAYRDDDGRLRTLSARCTHLGCIVGWNSADRAWECPCHGSRFAADGTLVQGPATADLPPEPLPD